MESAERAVREGRGLSEILTRPLCTEVLDAAGSRKGMGAPAVDAAFTGFLGTAIGTKHVDLGGARIPERIPRAKFRGPFFRYMLEQAGRTSEVLCILWARTCTALRQAAETLLRERGYAVFDLQRAHLHPLNWERATLETLAAELTGRVAGARADQAALMLFLLADAPDAPCAGHRVGDESSPDAAELLPVAPEMVSDAEKELERGLKSALLKSWLTQLEELDPRAPEWTELDGFLSACARLAGRKSDEARAHEALSPVREALVLLVLLSTAVDGDRPGFAPAG